MNKDQQYFVKWVTVILLVSSIVLVIGGYLFYTMKDTLENHPEITEIGGPPVITDLRLVVIVTIVAVVLCTIALKLGGEKIDEETKA